MDHRVVGSWRSADEQTHRLTLLDFEHGKSLDSEDDKRLERHQRSISGERLLVVRSRYWEIYLRLGFQPYTLRHYETRHRTHMLIVC